MTSIEPFAPNRRRGALTAAAVAACAAMLVASTVSAAPVVNLVKNIAPGTADSSPGQFTKLGTRVIFKADDGTHGMELWKTNGTPAGTKLIKDINPGPSSSNPDDFTVLGTKVYFFADDGIHGRELWRTDGTAAGTRMVKDINTGVATVDSAATQGSDGDALARVGSLLYFYADDGPHGRELWKSNGTARGTRLLADVNPGPDDSDWCCYVPMGTTVIFQAFDGSQWEMWRSDGTPAKTLPIFSLGSQFPDGLTVAGSRFFFSVDIGSAEQLGVSDGTPDGTEMLMEVADVHALTPLGNNVVFSGFDPATGRELYASDGTIGGSGLVLDIGPDEQSSDPNFWSPVPIDGAILFQACGEEGCELWRTDGTKGGSEFVKDINPRGDSSEGTDYRDVVNGKLYFIANDGQHGFEPWVSDGSEAGTMLLKDIVLGSGTSDATDGEVAGSFLYFTASTSGFGREVWRTNGTPASTKRVSDINPGPADAFPSELVPIGTSVYLRAVGPNGREPYRIRP